MRNEINGARLQGDAAMTRTTLSNLFAVILGCAALATGCWGDCSSGFYIYDVKVSDAAPCLKARVVNPDAQDACFAESFSVVNACDEDLVLDLNGTAFVVAAGGATVKASGGEVLLELAPGWYNDYNDLKISGKLGNEAVEITVDISYIEVDSAW